MPSDHYQRVLEQDAQLPAPVRWLSRAMSSWWTTGVLSTLVVGYVAAAHYPLAGRFLWQHRLIDSTQQAVVNWWPLQAAAITLAIVVVWTALRRLPMTWDSLGRFVTAMGLAIILVSQSWAFRYQETGVIAVPVAEQSTTRQTDPLSLTYTTRYGDPMQRVLVVMIGGAPPIAVPLDGLPRWYDASGDDLPMLKLHDDPRLSGMLNFRVRITPTAYLADGTLTETPDGKQTATPTPPASRNTTALPYPADALLAVTFEVEPDEGAPASTTVWLPFEPGSTDSLGARRFFQVEGLGSVGLSFRPASMKLPFAVAGSKPAVQEKWAELTLHLADADDDWRLLQPVTARLSSLEKTSTRYRAQDPNRGSAAFVLDWVYSLDRDNEHALLIASQNTSNPFITAGIVTFILGVALDLLMGWFGPKQQRGTKTKPTAKDTKPKQAEAEGAPS